MSKVRGRYYAYATALEDRPPKGAGVFEVLTGVDLVHWQSVGTALSALGAPYYRYWAPEVTEDNGRFLLYYAAHTAEFSATIRVAVAERPEGPFADSGRDLTGHLFPWAIDPHVFRDHDGRWYLYITIEYWNDPAGQTGSGNAVVRLRDPFTVEGAPARVTPPRHAWELFEARRPSPPPSSARTWPSLSCSPAPSCVSCGPVWTAAASPAGSAAAALGVVRRAHPGASDHGAILVRRGLQRAADCGTNGPRNVVPSVALAPKAWSYAGATFHTGKRGGGATMELPFILGWVLPVALVPSSLQYQRRASLPHTAGKAGPARSDGAEGMVQVIALRGDRGGGPSCRRS